MEQNAMLRQTDHFDKSCSFNYLVSRAGLEPATSALKDPNGFIAGVRSRDFSDD